MVVIAEKHFGSGHPGDALQPNTSGQDDITTGGTKSSRFPRKAVQTLVN
jgi:hypothetical protein